MAIMVGATVMRDASGNINDLWTIYNNSLSILLATNNATTAIENNTVITNDDDQILWSIYGTAFNCSTALKCNYGSHNSFEVFA